jgi:hypothetical protein
VPSRAFTRIAALGAVCALAAAPAIAQQAAPTLPPAQMVSPQILVARIDQNCGVYHSATQTERPTDIIEVKTNVWKIVADKDIAAAEKSNSFTTYAKVWKQAGNYVWIHEVTTGAKGGRHATQLCFRTDGTVQRIRQALTIPALDTASATAAYYRSDGSLIQKTSLFEENDPAIAKKIAALPFYKNLP